MSQSVGSTTSKHVSFAVCLLSFGLAAVFTLAGAAAQGVDGRAILERQQELHEVDRERVEFAMTLVDSRGRERERALHILTADGNDGLSRTLLKFTAPGDIRNTGLLTWEQKAPAEDDQWIYLPATQAAKRISGGGQKNLFMGTDLAFEDLRSENLDLHDYVVVDEGDCAGGKCWLIEATANTAQGKRNSGYSRRRLHVRQDIHFTVKIEYYNRGNRLAKVATYAELVNPRGELWRSNRVTMERLAAKTKTLLVATERNLDAELSAAALTQQALRRPVID